MAYTPIKIGSPVMSGVSGDVLYTDSSITLQEIGGTSSQVLSGGTPPVFTGSPVVTTQSTGDNSTKVATTAFVTTAVNNAIAGVNPAIAVKYATIAAGDTSGLTYSNGVSGIGATLTGANNTATVIDGHTFVVGDVGVTRVLVKNDTQSPSGAFNGVYLFTALHTAITGDVFTRALDYDSSSDINNTGSIPVVNGTANANTSWLLTSLVTTVGTDPLTYSQFSLAPTNVVTLTGTQTITNKRITRRLSAVTQSATPAINSDNMDIASITGLAQAITSMTTNLTGTPVDGDLLEIRITDNGTARAITWGASFESTTIALPTTTVISTMLRIGLEWNATASKWDCVAVC